MVVLPNQNKVVPKPEPSVSKQDLFNKSVQKTKENKETRSSNHIRSVYTDKPVNKIDLILQKISNIESSLFLEEVQAETISPEELRQWFDQMVEDVGIDKTFELLAERITK
ncbi:hypothetical protein QO179_23510 [Bacillus stercoris]|nr:hypothetical protein [Bacillus stercoris]